MKIILVLILSLSLVGCTEQERARNFGGHQDINLTCGQKLLMASWKEDDIWLLTRRMQEHETPETYSYDESSSWGSI